MMNYLVFRVFQTKTLAAETDGNNTDMSAEVIGTDRSNTTFTGNIGDTIMATITLPGNKMGANGILLLTAIADTAGLGTKTLRLRFNNSLVCVASASNSGANNISLMRIISNRNSTNSQIVFAWDLGLLSGVAGSGKSTAILNHDTTANIPITVTGQIGGGDSTSQLILRDFFVILFK